MVDKSSSARNSDPRNAGKCVGYVSDDSEQRRLPRPGVIGDDSGFALPKQAMWPKADNAHPTDAFSSHLPAPMWTGLHSTCSPDYLRENNASGSAECMIYLLASEWPLCGA
jgi:hypothetical protein